MSTADLVAVFASGGAVATSIGSLAVALTALLRDRVHLRVETRFALLTPSLDEVISLSVINNGRYTEIVSSVGFQTSDDRQVLLLGPQNFPEGPLPWTLNQNDSKMAVIAKDYLAQQWAHEKLGGLSYAFARTKSGRVYRDRPPAQLRRFIQGPNDPSTKSDKSR